ncbi:hypothetical protein SpCBS45565_g05766 [Spizellomyces sp. 'palustris']|nr:hypothetical protein SpCBS45565_g05766 [Spizellomyces sp. 'palustris']
MGKQKEPKEKKDKKNKKHHKDRSRDRSKRSKRGKSDGDVSPSPGSGSDSDGSEIEQWVEKPAAVQSPKSITKPASRESSSEAPKPVQEIVRDNWMMAPGEGFDFTQMGGQSEPRKREADIKREEEEKRRQEIRARRELNPYLKDGGAGVPTDESSSTKSAGTRTYEFGDSGANWRMVKLKRALEIANQEGKSVEEVAIERYGSLDAYEEAQAERDFLDKRRSGDRKDEFGRDIPYRPTFRKTAPFQRPGEGSFTKRPAEESHSEERALKRAKPASSTPSRSSAPRIPSVNVVVPSQSGLDDGPILSNDELNKLNANVLKAKLMGHPEAAELEAEYNRQRKRSACGRTVSEGQALLSNVDSRGRLQDIGVASSAPGSQGPQRRQHSKYDQDTHDEHGNRIRYSADDNKDGLSDLILQERMAGAHDFDTHMAEQITRDSTFTNNLDYMDDNIDRLSKRKQLTDDRKRNIAINDYQKHEKAVSKCSYCFQEGKKPRVPIVALGTKAYLALPEVVDMVPGHCIIVPLDHVLSSLECDDDTWTEIRNFQKALTAMFDENNQGVIFMEQVINLKWHKHVIIECIPLPKDVWEDAPGYFKEAINEAEGEWSQHRKIIDTSKNGFRGSMVKHLPYFHVWFDPNRGYGHVIEDSEQWREYFGREVIASPLDLSPDRWRRPRRVDPQYNGPRMDYFLERWKKYDWTAALDGGDY